MALPQIAGVVRCAVRGLTSNNTEWVNVHHMQYAGGASQPGSTEVANLDPILLRFYTGAAIGAGTAWSTKMVNTASIEQIDYTLLDGTSIGWTYSHHTMGAVAGGLPPECAPVLTLLTGKRGRRYRGRVYLPALATNGIDTAGNISSTVMSNTAAQYDGMIPLLAAAQWAPVVASYGVGSYHGVPTTWTPFATPITNSRMDKYMDVQRRRKQ